MGPGCRAVRLLGRLVGRGTLRPRAGPRLGLPTAARLPSAPALGRVWPPVGLGRGLHGGPRLEEGTADEGRPAGTAVKENRGGGRLGSQAAGRSPPLALARVLGFRGFPLGGWSPGSSSGERTPLGSGLGARTQGERGFKVRIT